MTLALWHPHRRLHFAVPLQVEKQHSKDYSVGDSGESESLCECDHERETDGRESVDDRKFPEKQPECLVRQVVHS